MSPTLSIDDLSVTFTQRSADISAVRQVSLAVCVAVLSAVVASVSGSRLLAFHLAYLTAAGIFAVGALAAFTLIRTSDAEPSMIRQ